jgi:creatinine amidohydrolase
MDMFAAHWTACRAAEEEPVIVFPAYPYGINIESAHLPGALVIQRELVFALLENICDEMGRNVITKIILHNGHGGNRYFLPLFVQTLPEKNKPYVVYYADLPFMPGAREVLEGDEFGHACEAETSMMRYIDEDTVRMDQVPPEPFTNQRRNQPLSEVGAYSPVDWYAMYPHMYVGDSSVATAEKGEVMLKQEVASLVALVRAVKADTVTPALVKEFLARMQKPSAPGFWTGD